MPINQVFTCGKKEKNEKRTRKEREYIYILKDVKTKKNKGDLFCSSIFLLYLCNTEINQQRTGANAGQTFKIYNYGKQYDTRRIK